ncbi:conserved Plasmodium protein, unknown function [Plasmodium malariae]|uniref:TFIIS central domain-containing protein n=1 Tax=Plasmodium malariae TaxID=5858 RepID=A0A1C3KCX9_PLAMA|nr:conserved Plasmodium protein, unknown function [Plasmodium malariae]
MNNTTNVIKEENKKNTCSSKKIKAREEEEEYVQFVDINCKNIFDYDLTKLDIRKVNNHMRLNDICKLYSYLNKNSFCYTTLNEKPSVYDILHVESYPKTNYVKRNKKDEKDAKDERAEKDEHDGKPQTHQILKQDVGECAIYKSKGGYNEPCVTNCNLSSGMEIIMNKKDEHNTDDSRNINLLQSHPDVPYENNNETHNIYNKNHCNSHVSVSSSNSCASSSESVSSSSLYSSYSTTSSSSELSSGILEKNEIEKNSYLNNLKNSDIIKKYDENKKNIRKKKKKKIKSHLGKLRKYDTISIMEGNDQIRISQIYNFVKQDSNINIISQLIYTNNECKKFLYNSFECFMNRWNVLPCLGYYNKNDVKSVINRIDVYNFYEFIYLFNSFPLCYEHNKQLDVLNFEKRFKPLVGTTDKSSGANSASFMNGKDNEAVPCDSEPSNEKGKYSLDELNGKVGSHIIGGITYRCNGSSSEATQNAKSAQTLDTPALNMNIPNEEANCSSSSRSSIRNSNNNSDNSTPCVYDEKIVFNGMTKERAQRGKNCSFRVFYYENFLCKNAKLIPQVTKNCVILNRRNNESLNFYINANLYEKIRDNSNFYYDKSNNYVLTYKNFEFLYFFCFNCRIYYDINIIMAHKIFTFTSSKDMDTTNNSEGNNKMYVFFQKYKKSYDIKIKRQKIKQTDIYFICMNCIHNNVYNLNEHINYFSYFCNIVNSFNHNFVLYNEYIKNIFHLDIPFFSLYDVTKEEVLLLTVQKNKITLNEKVKNSPAQARKKKIISPMCETNKKKSTKLGEHLPIIVKHDRVGSSGRSSSNNSSSSESSSTSSSSSSSSSSSISYCSSSEKRASDHTLVPGNRKYATPSSNKKKKRSNNNIKAEKEGEKKSNNNKSALFPNKSKKGRKESGTEEMIKSLVQHSRYLANESKKKRKKRKKVNEEGKTLIDSCTGANSNNEIVEIFDVAKNDEKGINTNCQCAQNGGYHIPGCAATNSGTNVFEKTNNKRDSKRCRGKKRKKKKKEEDDELFDEKCLPNESEDEYSFNEDLKDNTDEDIVEEKQILNEEVYSGDSGFYIDEYTSSRKKRKKRKKKGKPQKKNENSRTKKIITVKGKNVSEDNNMASSGNNTVSSGSNTVSSGNNMAVSSGNTVYERLRRERKDEEYKKLVEDLDEKDTQCNDEDVGSRSITKYTKVIDKIKQCLDKENMDADTTMISKNIVEQVIQTYNNKLDIKMKLFSICSNLLRKDNSELRKKILNGTISCSDLAQMDSSDLAPISLQNKRKEHERKYFYENIYLRENYINLKNVKNNDEEPYQPSVIYDEKIEAKKNEQGDDQNLGDYSNQNANIGIEKKNYEYLNTPRNMTNTEQGISNNNCSSSSSTKQNDHMNGKNKDDSTCKYEDKSGNPCTIPSVEKYTFEYTYKNLKSAYEHMPKYASSPILTFLDNSYNRILTIIDASKNEDF